MKKLIYLVITSAVVLSFVIGSTVMAAPAGKDTKANNNPQNLYLYPKTQPADPEAKEWDTVWNGAWGKYNFKLDGQIIKGVFNGHGLVADVDYTLLSYNDPWDSSPQFVVIGHGTADSNGNVHITGSADLGEDVASPVYDWNGPNDGYKIWLVLTADIDETGFITWNPDAYLFENNRIGATASAP